MEVVELIRKKRQLEKNIKDLLNDFSGTHGVSIGDLRIEMLETKEIGGGTKTFIQEIVVDIRL